MIAIAALTVSLLLLSACGRQAGDDGAASGSGEVPAPAAAPAPAADAVALRSSLMSAPLSAPRIYIGEGAAEPDLPPGGVLRLRALVRADSSDRASRYWLAEALRRDRDYRGAEAQFREAVRLDPGHTDSHVGLARTLLAEGRDEEAAAVLEEAGKAATPTAGLHFLRGQLAVRGQRWEQAAAAFGRAAAMEPSRDRLHFELARIHQRQGSDSLAAAALRRGLDHIPDSIGLRLRLAGLLRESGDFKGALRQVALVAEANPALTPAYVALARVHRGRGDLASARDAVDAGMEIDSLKIDLAAERGILLVEEGREAEAVPYLEKAVAGDPDLLEACAALRQAYERTGAEEKGQLMAGYVEHLGDHHAEIRRLKTAIALDQTAGAAFLALGNLYSHLVRPLAASQALEVGLQIHPGDVEALDDLALVFLGMRRLPRAIQTYERLLALDSTRVSAHANLGTALALSGEPNRALAAFDRALDLDPGFAPAHMGLARVYGQLGRAEEASAAMAEFERLRKAQPAPSPEDH